MYKLIIFDLDYILTFGQPINYSIVRQLNKIEAKGIKIALISYRTISYLKGFVAQLGLKNPTILAENGAIISTYKDCRCEYTTTDTRRLIEQESFEILYWIRNYVINEFGYQIFAQLNKNNLKIYTNIPSNSINSKKLLDSVFNFIKESKEIRWKALNISQNGTSDLYYSFDSNLLEIVPKDINREYAFQRLLKLLDINEEKTIAVVKNENDLSKLNKSFSIGIDLPMVKCRCVSINNIMDTILSLTNIKDDTDDIEGFAKIEYEQICKDWRSRDRMLWSVLTISISTAGLIAGLFPKIKEIPVGTQAIIFLLGFIFYFISLVKITKDHFYQLGSFEILERIYPNYKSDLMISDNPRIHSPENIIRYKKGILKGIFLIYSWIAVGRNIGNGSEKVRGLSTFKFFYIIQLIFCAAMLYQFAAKFIKFLVFLKQHAM